jgi:dihydrodipicolinate synthase/N-acetylneuraminate lyase
VKIQGTFVAPVTPRNPDGRINFGEFRALLDVLVSAGVDGVCVAGGTGEYPHFDLEERKILLEEAVHHVAGRIQVLACIGHSHFDRVVELGRHAEGQGVRAVLVPPPHFYTYSQKDLAAFYHELGRRLSVPCLLYNLPSFTTPLEEETIVHLLKSEPSLVGIKDSSGNAGSLQRFRRELDARKISLIVGQDILILDALEAGWDAVISGLANICPEVIVGLLRSFADGDLVRARYCQDQVSKLSHYVDEFPVPWAVRAGVETRGIHPGPPALPPARDQETGLQSFKTWFTSWLEETLAVVASSLSDG